MLFLLAIAVIVVSLGAAIAVDLSLVASRAQRLQNAADAAALAGVQAYRASNGDEAVAQAAVATLLEQNGIDPAGTTTFTVEFPDGENDTEVRVNLTDTDPGTLLSGVTGSNSDVSRSATAKFDSCAASCTVDVQIPSPFRSVEAEGSGDGYKPIVVDNEMYAINHNHSQGHIVCIDRKTADDPVIAGICEGWTSASQTAYASGAGSQRNPEMPHTAVIDTTIYWTASNAFGTHLFCFETATNTPCATTFPLNGESRASSSDISNQKDRNRGGGTVLAGDRIFVFTDDHRVHCLERNEELLARCAGYELNGKASSLGADEFPANDPSDGNHGSSIDRVVDEDAGKIYWTIHVPTGPPPPADCTQDNQEFPSGLVSIRNAASQLFMQAVGSQSISEIGTNDTDDTHWIVTAQGFDGLGTPRYSFRNVANGRVIDSDSGTDAPLETSSGVSADDKWALVYGVSTSTLESINGYAAETGTDFVTQNDLNGNFSHWIIQHPNCFDPGYSGPTATALTHEGGTWLQCWDYINDESCNGFTPSVIHTDGSRFSGRLFFHADGAATPNFQGLCSSGFADSIHPDNFEVNCVDNHSGVSDETMTNNMDPFESAIAGVTDSGPAAWGDPHYHPDSNRLFYPTAHDRSRVVCWDFDYGMCGVHQQTSALGTIEDYGYFSEGDCVYGLGHNAYFYAFQAEDIYSECTGSSARTQIQPCDCSGDWEWGTLTFGVDLALFDEFLIQVFDSDGALVYPPPLHEGDDPSHSLHTDGLTIDLNGLPVLDAENDFLEIVVSVNAESDPWAEGQQEFSVEFDRSPRLTD